MEKKNVEEKEEMTSLNEQVFAEYSVEELEQRLETDPMFLTNLFSTAPSDPSEGCCLFACNGFSPECKLL